MEMNATFINLSPQHQSRSCTGDNVAGTRDSAACSLLLELQFARDGG